jgi:hypothetical protein
VTDGEPSDASWTRPSAIAVAVLTGIVCVVWSALESWPGWWTRPHALLLVVGAGLLCAGISLAAVIVVRRRRGAPARGGLALVLAAALLGSTAGLTVTHAPLRIRFALDRTSFDTLADQAEQLRVDAALPPGASLGVGGPQRPIGSYRGRVETVDPAATSVLVSTPSSAHGGWFVRMADGAAAGGAQSWSIDLGGGWRSSKGAWIPDDD